VALDEQVRDEIRRSVFDSLPDGIVIVDLEGRITYANEQLARLSGYPAADLIGRKVEDLVPGAARGQHQRHRESYAAAGLPTRPMGTNLRIRLLTKGRTEVPVDISLRPLETGGGTRVLASIREAADRILSQERIEALLEVSQLILRGEAADEVLALIARRARHLVSADVAVVKVPSDDHSELAVQVADGVAEDELRGSRIPIEGSLAGEVFRSGRGRVVEDADSERLDADPLRKLGFGPSVVVPLSAAGFVFGTLTVANLDGRPAFGHGDLQVVELFASQAAVALDYSRVRDELRRLAVLEDRERIGRELHDGVIQSLFAVGMNLQASAMMAGPGDLSDRLTKGVTELDRAIGDLRNYIFGLRPGLLADRHLAQAIDQLAADAEEKSGITVVTEVDPQLAAQMAPLAADIVQVVRESLSNVARHSQAATCRVSLLRRDGRGVLAIEDDGRGFDPANPASGQGLDNLRDRVRRLGGELAIGSAPGDGTRVEIALPI